MVEINNINNQIDGKFKMKKINQPKSLRLWIIGK